MCVLNAYVILKILLIGLLVFKVLQPQQDLIEIQKREMKKALKILDKLIKWEDELINIQSIPDHHNNF